MNKTLLAWLARAGVCWAGWSQQQVCALDNAPQGHLLRGVAQRLSIRYTAGGSLMVSGDQRLWLGYGAPGLLSDLELALRVTPLLAAQAGVAGGVFFSALPAGALLAPMLGVTLHWPVLGLSTYLAMNGGAAFTGNVSEAQLEGDLILDKSGLHNVVLGVGEVGSIVAWESLLADVSFCSKQQAFSVGGMSIARCAHCDVTPTPSEPAACLLDSAFLHSQNSESCPRLDQPPICGDPQPKRMRPPLN